MTTVGQDSLQTRKTLTVEGEDFAYYSLDAAQDMLGDVSRLPYSLKVLLENLLRFEDGGFTVGKEHLQAVVDWQNNPVTGNELQYRPARVLLQDFTGVPCVVDLAAMRDAIKALGGTLPFIAFAVLAIAYLKATGAENLLAKIGRAHV